MSPCRVLHIVVSMDAGGIETMLMNYYRNIDRSKVQFDFLLHCEHKSFYEDEITMLGGKIFRVPYYHPKNIIKYLKSLNSFFKTHTEYKIVHSHMVFYSSFALKAAKKHGVPMRIAHSHCSNKFWRLDSTLPFRIWTRHSLKKQYTHVYACSPEAAEYMAPKKPFTILNNAIDAENFVFNLDARIKQRNQLNIINELLIGHIGRFTDEKNHGFILDVFAEILKKNADAKLVLVGGGKLFEKTKAKADSLGLADKIIFTGIRRDIAELMSAMDIFIFPSKFEGFPVTLVEAQASDLPCVISDTFSKTAVVSDRVKILSLNDAVDDWADSLLTFYNGCTRRDNFELIKNSGLDIKTNAVDLQNTYLEAYRHER
ncbi:MAG: glycosyltransferase family 1 protein [Ruminococcaceae bacterium]|nr:glycosyltransferase family 1 protein [Oscillospiraceae bacterium]